MSWQSSLRARRSRAREPVPAKPWGWADHDQNVIYMKVFWISSSYFQVTNAEQLLAASTQRFLPRISLDYNYRPAFNINYCNSPCSGQLCNVIMAPLAVHSTFLILQPGEFPSWQDVVNKTAVFWGLSVGFLIWALKTAAGYSIQDEQGQPEPLEHQGSRFLLHFQPQNHPMDVETPVGLMVKQWEQCSTTSPNTSCERAAPFLSKELFELSFLLINLIIIVMCHSARLKSHIGKGISMNLQQNSFQSFFLLLKNNKGFRWKKYFEGCWTTRKTCTEIPRSSWFNDFTARLNSATLSHLED